MHTTEAGLLITLQGSQIEIDLRAKSVRHLAIAVPMPRISSPHRLGIAHNDVTAPSPDKLVQAHVFEMPAIAQVHIARSIIHGAKQLLQ